MSALTQQLPILPSDILVVGRCSSDLTTGSDLVVIAAGETAVLRCRFALPRAVATSKGSKLNGVALNYTLSSGTLTSVTPALTSVIYTDNVAVSTATIPLDTASPAARLVEASECRMVSAVTTPAYDNGAATTTKTYLASYTIIASTAVTIAVHGAEALYSGADSDLAATTAGALNATGTLTAALIKGGIVTSTTAAAVSATTDTATLILAQLDNPAVGDTIRLHINNTGPNAFTILAGDGVTLVGTVAIATLTSRNCLVRVTAVGTPAVTLYM